MYVVVDVISDRELWLEAVGGRADAFGVLFERHARVVYNVCFRRTGDWSSAEDLTSEAFLLAWRRRGEVVFTTEGGSVLPWLLGVVLNLIRNSRRSGRRADAAVARLDASEYERDFSDELIGRLADEEQMRGVLAVVERLPVQEQEVLALCVWAGLSYEDCALALRVPLGTVRSRLSRARARLRELEGSSGHEMHGEPAMGTCG